MPKEALPDRNNAPPAPRGSVTYGYDNASQLTGLTYKNGSTTLGNLTYSYDLAGRRINTGGSYARTGTPQAAPSASYNVNNQLTNWKGATLQYDANGNLTSDGTNTYNWNARNQLVTIGGPVPASFQYDPFGRRVSKTIGGTTQYLYDGANPVQEISGTSASANLLTGGVDEYFQRTDLAGARNFLTDALGSTLALADSTGAVQTQYTFEPFGNTSVTGTATTNSFAYTGRELDTTGLYFLRARYYSPNLGRFISQDPLGFAGSGTNLYAYSADNPVNVIDPFGTENSISHFAESMWASILDPSFALTMHDPFNPTSDVLTDVNTQGTDAYDANIHAMAGWVKVNGRKQWQTCSQALNGAADFIATQMNSDRLGQAEHTAQDWATPSHGGAPWPGGFPTSDHMLGDWIGNLDPTYYDARMNNLLWIRQHMPIRTHVPVTAAQVRANMQGGQCQ